VAPVSMVTEGTSEDRTPEITGTLNCMSHDNNDLVIFAMSTV
jgi:hypothetical protein